MGEDMKSKNKKDKRVAGTEGTRTRDQLTRPWAPPPRREGEDRPVLLGRDVVVQLELVLAVAAERRGALSSAADAGEILIGG